MLNRRLSPCVCVCVCVCVCIPLFLSSVCWADLPSIFQCLSVRPSIHIKNHQFTPAHPFLVHYHRVHSNFPLSISDGGGHSPWHIAYLTPLPFVKVDTGKSLSVLSLFLIFWALPVLLNYIFKNFPCFWNYVV